MRRVLIIVMFFWFFIATLSGLFHQITVEYTRTKAEEIKEVTPTQVALGNWLEVIEKISPYRPAVKISEAELEQQRLAEEAAKRQPALYDAVLVGTVLTHPNRALLVLPNSNEPQVLEIGDSWLSPWALESIGADFITWKNTQTEQIEIQALFR